MSGIQYPMSISPGEKMGIGAETLNFPADAEHPLTAIVGPACSNLYIISIRFTSHKKSMTLLCYCLYL